ncbi:hypothetical protein BZG36_04300 [Bifiguratus adelaidae]|uniref:CCD97-like C-terminal domain-containing protein n=1 Tax=Bifiguratus adelaidae TaxID=1938954 RepID=A0A261XZP2_9FUNG|nr:hypothetical protein BZG36_04300 [Bifiguratus adelaidae]
MEAAERAQVVAYISAHLDDIHYKTLRRDEPELPRQHKLAHMTEVLSSDPGLFLSRWGRFLPSEQLARFECLTENYEVSQHLKSLLPQHKSLANSHQRQTDPNHIRTHNRRYRYLLDHLRHTDYFSLESMQAREPWLYQQYIGRFVSQPLKPFADNVGLVDRVLYSADQREIADKAAQQQRIEEEQMEEEEEEDDEEEEEEEEKEGDERDEKQDALTGDRRPKDPTTLAENKGKSKALDHTHPHNVISETHRQELEQEFVRLMEEMFLDGRDKDFDYSAVDDDERLDDLEQEERDQQEAWFDETDEEDNEVELQGQTGILDY